MSQDTSPAAHAPPTDPPATSLNTTPPPPALGNIFGKAGDIGMEDSSNQFADIEPAAEIPTQDEAKQPAEQPQVELRVEPINPSPTQFPIITQPQPPAEPERPHNNQPPRPNPLQPSLPLAQQLPQPRPSLKSPSPSPTPPQNPSQQLSPSQIEQRILQLAKSIRKRVRHNTIKQPDPHQLAARRAQPKSTPRRDAVLTPLHYEDTMLLTNPESQRESLPKAMRSILMNDILGKVWDEVEVRERSNKVKLRLDPIKHRYPVTSFRKAVLEEGKSFQMIEAARQRQRLQKLLLRRDLYKSSRYQRYTSNHPPLQVSPQQQTTYHLLTSQPPSSYDSQPFQSEVIVS